MNMTSTGAALDSESGGLRRGTTAYRRANVALFAAGFATFSSLYSVQPLIPLFSESFNVGAAVSSLSLSVSTGVLAFTLFIAGLMSEAIDRKKMMGASTVASAALSVIAAFAPGWGMLLVARAAEGLALGGVPVLAIAYLSEEVEPGDLGSAMGLYIAGRRRHGRGAGAGAGAGGGGRGCNRASDALADTDVVRKPDMLGVC